MNYDPFVKEDFILPEKWYVSVTNETVKDINIFKSKTCWEENAINYKAVGYEGVGYNSPPNGYTEITFEQFKKYVLKEVIETPKVVIPEYVELLEGFDNTCTGKIFDTNQPIPQMSGWSNQWTWESIFKNNIQRTYFKPSTKEAFDAQNQPKSIEKWSVGSYFVIEKDELYNINSSKRGDICLIKENGNFNFINKKDTTNWSFDLREGSSWFATKSEAEKFAKTLAEPVNRGNGILDAVDVKQPLKQVVHCKTQEEWDFVSNKIGYKFINKFELGNSDTINPLSKGCQSKSFFEGHEEYQILSFQEWCDLNGYKMEKEVKFEVGKWYRVTDGESKYIGNYRWYAKSPTLINNIIKTEEYLYENSICKCGNFGKIGTYTFTEVSIEEIQQYLPDGHPDKIKVDREFKIGEYIFVMTKGGCYRDILKVTSVEPDEKDSGIKGTVWIKHENSSFSGGGFRLGSKYRYNEHVRHATPEEINNHLISIRKIPAGEPLNTGIEPNKDGMFKYKQTMPGASWSGGTIDNHLDVMIPTTGNSYNKDFSTSIIPVKSISTAIEFNYLPEPK